MRRRPRSRREAARREHRRGRRGGAEPSADVVGRVARRRRRSCHRERDEYLDALAAAPGRVRQLPQALDPPADRIARNVPTEGTRSNGSPGARRARPRDRARPLAEEDRDDAAKALVQIDVACCATSSPRRASSGSTPTAARSTRRSTTPSPIDAATGAATAVPRRRRRHAGRLSAKGRVLRPAMVVRG